ncbi:DNA-formamidopyrimidine glycosylase [Mesoplasma lactucae]|uniref:DNA-formamidopyrimidine glycosylase n=1 Tax=Mesoplasma lactucae ATCC 49193 TaxID=81460 RepID=A0A291IS86_9MOLU|nr:DNA-formamidopyrimidine glycosylase [Mesoplasma lactucae]ATG97557.1 DNA-formamidopyrimidine glycosylase [Mesoplasma lactucae ATCC 49193]ATZ19984.1 formamidopyrimidine-DNA glycosylase [Mesoplasma lactucae ATCC 49193]MCL8217065.1 Formamidopyrimidine-DNA glycosylase [Mesoplasma lactucae ATCC 49193]
MPELPEVRMVVRYLNENVQGKTIDKVNIFYKRLLVDTTILELQNNLPGQIIESVQPYGKYIIFHLTDFEMISHLRMEGKWICENPETFTYGESLLEAQFWLKDDANILRYYDSRRFGTLQLVKKGEWKNLPSIAKLGPEPFDKEATPEYLYSKTSKTTRAIKTVLLDQTVLLGLGNIYVNEVLWASEINPEEPANRLTLADDKKILEKSREILNDSIAHGGTTIHSFAFGDKHVGEYQRLLKVHGKNGKECPRCGAKIVKTVVGGRGTYYCPVCQKIK